ncbi:hypothetical protein ERYG_00157 [Escherichia coli M114]|nr:hypothetical protein ERYG_00157 [Escherichia coli M114]
MNGIKTGLGITPGEHIISADSALSRNIRQCFCLSCHGRLILQTDAQGAWFEHDLHALSEQQKADCVVLNPEKSHPYIEDMAMFLSPLPVVLEWHCVMCEQFFHGKKFCEACGTGIYCRAVCTKSVYSYQPDLFEDCGVRVLNPKSPLCAGRSEVSQPAFYPVFRTCPVRDTKARHRISAVLLT